MRLRRPRGRYTGPRCYVGQTQLGADGKLLEGGWHYSTRVVFNRRQFFALRLHARAAGQSAAQAKAAAREGATHELPDRKLHLNDSAPEEAGWFYEYAEPDHLSWLQKHGPGNLVHAAGLPAGEEHPPDAHDGHPFHEAYHAARGSKPGRSVS